MSTINEHYTMSYSQPKEYRFSHDSVFLARKSFEYLMMNKTTPATMLDLCSGCGVIGIDILIHLHKNNLPFPKKVEFLEIQEIYQKYFEENRRTLKAEIDAELDLKLLMMNYDLISQDEAFQNKYDFIICNPPYFQMGHGKLSPSEFKNRCRFFIDSNLKNLLKAIGFSLAPNGVAFILIKSLSIHGIDTQKVVEEEISANGLTVRKIDSVRGTDLFELAKPLGFSKSI